MDDPSVITELKGDVAGLGGGAAFSCTSSGTWWDSPTHNDRTSANIPDESRRTLDTAVLMQLSRALGPPELEVVDGAAQREPLLLEPGHDPTLEPRGEAGARVSRGAGAGRR